MLRNYQLTYSSNEGGKRERGGEGGREGGREGEREREREREREGGLNVEFEF